MRKPRIVANWKMHGSCTNAQALLEAVCTDLTPDILAQIDVTILPPFVYLAQARSLLTSTQITWGAQHSHECLSGAFTGEISPAMLVDLGCRYVLVGHSERRHLYHESDDLIATKCRVAVQQGLTPILCVGETFDQRQQGHALAVIHQQLEPFLQKDQDSLMGLQQACIAYEPVWAIGTGQIATPEQIQTMHADIRAFIRRFDEYLAQSISILYGGSLKAEHTGSIASMPDVDGGLVGGASLKSTEFVGIVKAWLNHM